MRYTPLETEAMDVRVGLLLLAALLSLQGSTPMRAEGVAVDELGNPLRDVQLHVFRDRIEVASIAVEDGGFTLEVSGTLYIYADDPSTPGVDYLPIKVEAPWSGVRTLVFRPAATLIVRGSAQFVDSKELPISTTFTVVDLEGKPIEVDGLTLIYGGGDSLTSLLDLEEDVIIVPAGMSIGVSVNCSVLVGSTLITRCFPLTDEPLRLEGGEVRGVSLLAASMPLNLKLVGDLLGEVSQRIEDMRSEGFYLEVESSRLREASTLLEEARYLSSQGLYIEGFDAARRCYLNLKTLDGWLRHLRIDASTSIYLLLAFLSSTSTLTALLLLEGWRSRLITALSLYAVSLSALRWSYPGFSLLSPPLLALSSIASLSATLISLYILSHITPKARGDGHIPVRNLIGPIIAIGRRNLRRRRLRTLLTLSSLMILIASFVSLTSVSTGYGLTAQRVGRSNWRGVLLRPGGMMLQGLEETVNWLLDQPGVEAVAPKAESMPTPNPHTSLMGHPIYGIVGVDPEDEGWASGLGELLIEGHLPSPDGVAISSKLAEELGLSIGDEVNLLGWTLTVEGLLSDDGLRRLREIDGSPYLPEKLVNISPEGEPPNFIPMVCEPREVVILHISRALMAPLVSPSRLSVRLGDVDVEGFASRMALERGFEAYASTGEVVYLYRLSSYLEGRGLPLLIPWLILLLNIASITLSALRERRWEVSILSAIGLNPTQIAAVFLVEASILGFVGGGLGHLIGLSLYRVLALLGIPLSVYQKVSALWCLASLALSSTVALVGAAVALKSSVILTPSLMLRWRLRREEEEAWIIPIPVRLRPGEEADFVEYVADRLSALKTGVVKRTSLIRLHRLPGAYEIEFIYKSVGQALNPFYTRNRLRVERGSVTLTSIGAERWAYEVGSLLRMIAVEWASLRGSTSPPPSQHGHPSARQSGRSP